MQGLCSPGPGGGKARPASRDKRPDCMTTTDSASSEEINEDSSIETDDFAGSEAAFTRRRVEIVDSLVRLNMF